MNKTILLFVILFTIFIVLGLAFFSDSSTNKLSAQSKKSSFTLSKKDDVKTTSLIPMVRFSFVKKENERIVVEINNNSGKDITAYQIRLDTGSKLLVDRSISGIYRKSEEKYEQEIPISNSNTDTSEAISEITLDTAVFSDNSSEGDEKVALYIKEHREGIKRQLEKIIPLLNELDLNLTAIMISDKSNFITSTKKEVEKLSDKTDNVSDAVNDGLRDAKRTVKRLLDNLEQNLSQENSFRNYSYGVKELKEWLSRLSK